MAALLQAATAAANPLAHEAYRKADWVFQHARHAHYEHVRRPAEEQVVQLENGDCESVNDCGGFISWVLHSVAPEHYEAVHRSEPNAAHPLARGYARFFASLSSDPINPIANAPPGTPPPPFTRTLQPDNTGRASVVQELYLPVNAGPLGRLEAMR